MAKADHFKLWKAQRHNGPSIGGPVMLKGQFDSQPWKADVREIRYVANPADKNQEGIPDPRLHYVVYAIDAAPQTPRSVLVKNQFVGSERWDLSDPKWLLVPADLRVDSAPDHAPKGNHYVCYAAMTPKIVRGPVSVVDAFDQEKPEVLQELKPAYFCVPVEKTREGHKPEPIIDGETHLAVYAIEHREHRVPVKTNDQFGKQNLDVLHSEFLAVPSLKRVLQ